MARESFVHLFLVRQPRIHNPWDQYVASGQNLQVFCISFPRLLCLIAHFFIRGVIKMHSRSVVSKLCPGYVFDTSGTVPAKSPPHPEKRSAIYPRPFILKCRRTAMGENAFSSGFESQRIFYRYLATCEVSQSVLKVSCRRETVTESILYLSHPWFTSD